MDTLIPFLTDWGYWGMLVAAFLAGSFFPFSSEAVMAALIAANLNPWQLVVYGSIGNVAGSLFNYFLGRLGKMEWIEKYLHVKKKDLEKAQKFMKGKGAWAGFFAFLPIIGSGITIALGLMRANLPISITSITIGKVLRYIILVASILSLCSCNIEQSSQPVIAVTIEPMQYFTEQIVGDRYQVMTMVPSGMSPETYEPTPRQIVELSHAEYYMKVGKIGFEQTWMRKLKQNAPGLVIIDTSKGITPIRDINGIEDPHTWMSCSSAKNIATQIYLTVARKSPKDSSFYKNNYLRLIRKINQVDTKIRTMLKKHPSNHSAFLIYHPTLTYFSREYNFEQIPLEEEGKEPSASQTQALIDRAKQKDVRTIFVQKQFSPRKTITIQEATNTGTTEINPLNYNWCDEMLKIAQSLTIKNRK